MRGGDGINSRLGGKSRRSRGQAATGTLRALVVFRCCKGHLQLISVYFLFFPLSNLHDLGLVFVQC